MTVLSVKCTRGGGLYLLVSRERDYAIVDHSGPIKWVRFEGTRSHMRAKWRVLL